ncbi:NACHT domain-containing protein [Streptomyces sp. NPDC057257]|uniref:NACHT domain-containing protein n=1 Tax=Streptomyces sp. NPDC057257 TaxID=3346071 RepID=UPI00362FD7EC
MAVRQQWEVEAGVRGLHDPRPLAVTWKAAPEELVEEWAQLSQMATESVGAVPDPSGWAAGPAELAGSGAQILRVFRDQVPTRRLVVLGEPGSGKTMLLVRLLLGFTACRAPGTPVPVLFTLSSWDPAEQDLQSWIVHQLTQDFDELVAPSAAAFGSPSRARALVEHRLILPLLDGFDELPARARSAALDQINSVLPPGEPVVLSSRAAEYAQCTASDAGLPRKLVGAAGIELLPLDSEATAAYLRRDAGGAGTPAAARWDRVLRILGSDHPAAQALRTPLMIFLARTIYNPRTGEPLNAVPHPTELLDNPSLSTRASIKAHLFKAFVPAVYRAHPRLPARWSTIEAERTLRWLAKHAQTVRAGTPDLAWWQLHRAAQRWLPLLMGVLAGTAETCVSWVITVATLLAGGFFPGSRALSLEVVGSAWPTASSGGLLAGLIGGLAGRIPGGMIGGALGAAGAVHDIDRPGSGLWPPGFTLPYDAYTWQIVTAGLIYGFVGGLMGEVASGLAARRAGGEIGPGHRRRQWNWRAALVGFTVGAGYGYAETQGPEAGGQRILPVIVGLACFFGLAGGLAAGQGALRTEVLPAAEVRWTLEWRGLLIGLAGTLAVALPTWIVDLAHFGFYEGVVVQFVAGQRYVGSTPVAGAYCLAGGLVYGFKAAAADLTQAPAPPVLLARDRRTFRKLTWVTALTVGVLIGPAVWWTSSFVANVLPVELLRWEDIVWWPGRGNLVRGSATGVLVGCMVGLAVAWNQTACGWFLLARCYLTIRRRLPWRLMDFLVDAHHQGVLRQSGAVYQFRHIELQRHLAARLRQDDPDQRAGDEPSLPQ